MSQTQAPQLIDDGSATLGTLRTQLGCAAGGTWFDESFDEGSFRLELPSFGGTWVVETTVEGRDPAFHQIPQPEFNERLAFPDFEYSYGDSDVTSVLTRAPSRNLRSLIQDGEYRSDIMPHLEFLNADIQEEHRRWLTRWTDIESGDRAEFFDGEFGPYHLYWRGMPLTLLITGRGSSRSIRLRYWTGHYDQVPELDYLVNGSWYIEVKPAFAWDSDEPFIRLVGDDLTDVIRSGGMERTELEYEAFVY